MAKLVVILKARPIWLLVAAVVVALVVGLLIPVGPGFRGPLVDVNDAILIAVLVALGAFVAQLYVDRGQMLSRIGKLEADLQAFRTENDGLRDDLRAAASFIDRVGLWMVAGMPPAKRPRPPQQLADHIDAELWAADPAIGGTDPD